MKKVILSILGCGILWSCNSDKKTKEDVLNNVTQENQMVYAWSLNAILNSENGASDFIHGGEKNAHLYKNDYQKALKEWWECNK